MSCGIGIFLSDRTIEHGKRCARNLIPAKNPFKSKVIQAPRNFMEDQHCQGADRNTVPATV